jgi:hypothetical protein
VTDATTAALSLYQIGGSSPQAVRATVQLASNSNRLTVTLDDGQGYPFGMCSRPNGCATVDTCPFANSNGTSSTVKADPVTITDFAVGDTTALVLNQ